MNHPLPPEIQVISTPQGACYRLPFSMSGADKVKAVGMLLLAAGCAAFSYVAWRIIKADPHDTSSLAFMGLLLPTTLTPLFVIYQAIQAFGRPELSVVRGQLRLRRRLGSCFLTERVQLADLPSLYVALRRAASPRKLHPIVMSQLAQVEGLGYIRRGGKRRLWVRGLRAEWMLALASRLSEDAARPEAGGRGRALPVGHFDSLTGEWLNATPEGQLPGAVVQITEVAGGIVAVVPNQGFRQGTMAYGLVIVGCILLGMGTLLSFVFGFAGIKFEGNADPRGLLVVTIPAALGGVFVLLHARKLARRKTSLRVSSQEFIIVQHAPGGDSTTRIEPLNITAIEVAATATELNDRRVRELRLSLRTGGSQVICPEIPDGELDWFAAQLRKALNIPHQPGLWPVPQLTRTIEIS